MGTKTLQTIYQTFDPHIPVIFHLPALTTSTDTDTIPMLFVIQEGRHCMPTTDYYFMNIQPDPITIPPHRGNNPDLTSQHAATKDQISQQTQPLRPGKTRVYPSMLADKQVPVLDSPTPLSHHKWTSRQLFSHYICVLWKKTFYPMAENNPQKKEKIPTDYISDSKSSEEETSQH